MVMRYRSILILALVAGIPVFTGCAKKGPKTGHVETLNAAPSASAPSPAVAAPAPAADAGTDIWSADFDALNAYLREHGLLGDVYFDTDRAELKADGRERLAKNAAFLQSHPELVVTIEGHCDERATAEYNFALGDARSNAARSYVMNLGVSAERLRSISYGEERPVCTSSTEQCWWQNRRSHFVVTGRQSPG
jgi:peptidoglycan-associated lipoprotein